MTQVKKLVDFKIYKLEDVYDILKGLDVVAHNIEDITIFNGRKTIFLEIDTPEHRYSEWVYFMRYFINSNVIVEPVKEWFITFKTKEVKEWYN